MALLHTLSAAVSRFALARFVAALSLTVLALSFSTITLPAHAGDSVRWPSSTGLPKPPQHPAPPPAVLERAPSARAFIEADQRTVAAKTKCEPGRTCVVCVAACDIAAPVVVQQMKPQPTGTIAAVSAETNSDGVAAGAPKHARQEWAGITCGAESGCRVSGVNAPNRSSYDVDVRMSVFTYTGGSGSGSPSGRSSPNRYIDK
jgi:hypothetical protein